MSKLALGFALVVAMTTVQGQERKAGQVLFAVGNAARIAADGAVRPLTRGDAVYERDTLRTGSEAHLQVRMSDGALIALRPASELRLKSYDERAFFELVKGAFRSITGAIGRTDRSYYRIQSHQTLIGIRGTDHETRLVEGDAGAGTYNRVTLGGTYLQTRGGRIDLDPGQTGFAPLKPDAVPVRLEETPGFMVAFLPPAAPHGAPGTRGLQQAPGLDRAPGLDLAPGLPGSQAPALLLERGGAAPAIPGEVLRRQGLPNGKAKH